MKKYYILLSAVIGMLFLPSYSYANVDEPRITHFRYECIENREGILRVVFNLSGHHSYYRDYKINQKWFIEVKDANHTSIHRSWNFYIPWCGCPEALTGVTRFASYSWTNTDDLGVWDYGQTTTHGWDDTWVYLNGPILRTTTVVTLYPVNNGIPETCAVCKNPATRECRLTSPQTRFYTNTGWIRYTLVREGGANTGTACIMPRAPKIECTAGTGAQIVARIQDGMTGSREDFVVNIPPTISSKVWTCTLTHATNCERERREVIEIVAGGSPLCQDPTRTPDCIMNLSQKDFSTTASWLLIPIDSHYSASQKCIVPPAPSIICKNGTGARVLVAMRDMPSGGTSDPLDFQPKYSVVLPQNVTGQFNECTLSYPATSCTPSKIEKINIYDTQCDARNDEACTLSLLDTVYNTTTGSLTIPLHYNNSISILWTGTMQTLTCTSPKIPSVTCTALNTGSIRILQAGTGYTLVLPPEVASKEWSCSLRTATNTCWGSKVETFTLRDRPTRVETWSITEERVCFRLRGASWKAVSGMKITTTLQIGGNTYITFQDTDRRVYTFNDVEVVGDQYCVNIPGGGGGGGSGPGGPVPGPRPITITVQWCNDPFRCTITQPGGFIITPKKCSAYLEVLDNGAWNRDGVLYNKKQSYRVHVRGNACNGNISMLDGTLIPKNGSFSGAVPTSFTQSWIYKVFDVTLKKPDALPPNTLRWLSVNVLYEDPQWFRYGLTESDTDWRDSPLSISGTRMNGVYIIGNTSWVWQNMYNLNNASNLSDVTSFNTLQNVIRQNVANVTRGIPTWKVTNRVLYYKDVNPVRYSTLDTSFDTLIVDGWDVILDTDIPTSKWIIVLKGKNDVGWNIIVGDAVTYMQTLIFAEGIMRGAKVKYGELNVDAQLVLKWALYTKNTIGGSADPNNLFLYPKTVTTNKDEAFVQDLNNIRMGNGWKLYRSIYGDPFIIEYDGSIAQSPFPWFVR